MIPVSKPTATILVLLIGPERARTLCSFEQLLSDGFGPPARCKYEEDGVEPRVLAGRSYVGASRRRRVCGGFRPGEGPEQGACAAHPGNGRLLLLPLPALPEHRTIRQGIGAHAALAGPFRT